MKDSNPPIKVYSNERQNHQTCNVTSNFSELDKIFWIACKKALKNKVPLVFGYPYFKTNYLTILAYYLTTNLKKDVLIVSDKQNIDSYIENYELLANENGDYLFRKSIPIVLLEENKSEVNIVLKRMPKKEREKEVSWLFSPNMLNLQRKIIFCQDMYLSEALEKNQEVSFPEIGKETKVETKIGAILLDNFDLNKKSEEYISAFKKWISKMTERGIFVLIKTQEISSNQINTLELGKDIEKLFFNYPVLAKYYNNFEKYPLIYSLLPSQINSPNLEKKIIPQEDNMDYHKRNLDDIANAIREDEKQLPDFIYHLINLKEKLPTLFIHPADFMFPYLDKEGNYRTLDIDRYLSFINEDIKNYPETTKQKLRLFVSAFSSYYGEMKETRRPNQIEGYSKQGKNFFLIELIQEFKTKVKKINVVVFSRRAERSILQEQISRLDLSGCEVEVLTYFEAIKRNKLEGVTFLPSIPFKNSDLIKLEYICEKLMLVLYDGQQNSSTTKRLEKINEQELIEEFLSQIIKLIPKEEMKSSNLSFTEKSCSEYESVKKIDTKDKIIEIKQEELSYPELDNPLKFEDFIERDNNAKSYNLSPEQNSSSLELENMQSGEKISINCNEFSKFMVIEEGKNGEYSNKYFAELTPGDIILRLGNQKEEDILSVITELYGFEDKIDMSKIRYWKSRVNNWIISRRKNLGKSSSQSDLTPLIMIYKEYETRCKELKANPKTYVAFHGWANEKRIGPEDPLDVMVLGSLSQFPLIREEYNSIFKEMQLLRKAHIIVGKKINKIINYLLSKKEMGQLDYAEQLLYDKINIFKVINKKESFITKEGIVSDKEVSIKKEENKIKSKKIKKIDNSISHEEHEKKIKILREMGLIK